MLKWDMKQHPTYSPNMVPSNYYHLSHLQLHLDGTIFNSNEKVINEADLFMDVCTPQFFAEGMENLPKRWKNIVDLIEDYYPH